MVKNRDRWTVDAIHRDGSVTVTGRSGEIRLPAEYVAEHVELAYAETSHASQGRTVDRSFLFLDGPTGAAGIYVPMTRGRESNEVFVAIRGEETPADVVSEALARTWIDRPAIAVRDELTPTVVDDDDEGALTRAMPGHELRRVVERTVEVQIEIRTDRIEAPGRAADESRQLSTTSGRLSSGCTRWRAGCAASGPRATSSTGLGPSPPPSGGGERQKAAPVAAEVGRDGAG